MESSYTGIVHDWKAFPAIKKLMAPSIFIKLLNYGIMIHMHACITFSPSGKNTNCQAPGNAIKLFLWHFKFFMSQIITAIVVTDHRTLYFGVYYSAEIFRPAISCYRNVKIATFNGSEAAVGNDELYLAA